MNCVRKHLSRIKAGAWPRPAPARVVTSPSATCRATTPIIASGPRCPMPAPAPMRWRSSTATASGCPPSVPRRWSAGELRNSQTRRRGASTATPCTSSPPQQSLEAGCPGGRPRGRHRAHILSDEMKANREVGGAACGPPALWLQRGERLCVLLSGGETTAQCALAPESAPGPRWRAGEFCMAPARPCKARAVWPWRLTPPMARTVWKTTRGHRHAGTPGPWLRPGFAARRPSDCNDAYGYFSALGDLVVTGPTHTNVNEFQGAIDF